MGVALGRYGYNEQTHTTDVEPEPERAASAAVLDAFGAL